MSEGITFVGLDSHKESIQVAMLLSGETKPVEWQAANDAATVRRMVKSEEKKLLTPGRSMSAASLHPGRGSSAPEK